MKKAENRRRMAARMAAVILAAGMAAGTPVTALAAGWQKAADGSWTYEQEEGGNLAGGFTPDGYYIDSSGIWRGTKTILETEVASRNSFLTAEEAGNFESFEAPLSSVHKVMQRELGSIRSFTVYTDRIVCYAISDKNHKELYALYKDPSSGGYVLELKTGLRKEKGNKIYAAWYDFQSMRLLFNMVSRTGDSLADAVYESWEGGNSYGLALNQWIEVGDSRVRYEPVSGAGMYYIAPAF